MEVSIAEPVDDQVAETKIEAAGPQALLWIDGDGGDLCQDGDPGSPNLERASGEDHEGTRG